MTNAGSPVKCCAGLLFWFMFLEVILPHSLDGDGQDEAILIFKSNRKDAALSKQKAQHSEVKSGDRIDRIRDLWDIHSFEGNSMQQHLATLKLSILSQHLSTPDGQFCANRFKTLQLLAGKTCQVPRNQSRLSIDCILLKIVWLCLLDWTLSTQVCCFEPEYI